MVRDNFFYFCKPPKNYFLTLINTLKFAHLKLKSMHLKRLKLDGKNQIQNALTKYPNLRDKTTIFQILTCILPVTLNEFGMKKTYKDFSKKKGLKMDENEKYGQKKG